MPVLHNDVIVVAAAIDVNDRGTRETLVIRSASARTALSLLCTRARACWPPGRVFGVVILGPIVGMEIEKRVFIFKQIKARVLDTRRKPLCYPARRYRP